MLRPACVIGVALAAACTDPDGPLRTPELLTTTASPIVSLAVDDVIYLSTYDRILKAPKVAGDAITLAVDQPATRIVVSGDHVYWSNSLASVDRNRFELVRMPKTGGTPQLLVDFANVAGFVVDRGMLYWTEHDGFGVYMMAKDGGPFAILTEGGPIERTGVLALDEQRVYVTSHGGFDSRLLSFTKTGDEPYALMDESDASGTISYMVPRGDAMYFIAATGGSPVTATANVVTKTAEPPVEYMQDTSIENTYCTSMPGLAVDDHHIYIACRAIGRVLLRRITIADGTFTTMAVFDDLVSDSGALASPTVPALDKDFIYFGLGEKLYRVAK